VWLEVVVVGGAGPGGPPDGRGAGGSRGVERVTIADRNAARAERLAAQLAGKRRR